MYNYKYDKENCWYKKTCNKYNTNYCNANCIRYIEIDFLMNSSNIPKSNKYKNELIPSKIDLQSFNHLAQIKSNILDFVNNGDNLYIFSKNFGNGKTTWSIKLLQKYFDKIWIGNGLKVRGIFLHVPTFLTKCKEVISKKDAEFELLKQKLIEVDLVVWDDIAASKLTDYDYTNLLTYIDQRKLNGKANIYNGNLDESELIDAVGNRLKSRIWNDSTVIQLFGNDRRGGIN